ncbi:HD domain-containing protein [bacterium]
MIKKSFIYEIFNAAYMQRWNDKISPVELRELDKQAHKMIIAYVFGKFEEESGNPDFDWIQLIEGGIFELLQRIVVTDLRPQLFYKIKSDKSKYRELNNFVIKQFKQILLPIEDGIFLERFKDYLFRKSDNINNKILNAAHFYTSSWEFRIIKQTNPDGYEINEIEKDLIKKQELNYDLIGMQKLTLSNKLKNFVDLCGELRFQNRWSHLHRIPRTSVLGHMLIVAVLTYLYSLELKACKRRCINNFYSGLFHDLPEVLTRDIINPLKSSIPGLDRIIKIYEKEEMKKIYSLIPKTWHREMRVFTEIEFTNLIISNSRLKRVSSEDLCKKYNSNKFNPRDGRLVEFSDKLAAFVEAHLAIKNGARNNEFKDAKESLITKYKSFKIAGQNLGEIYNEFV